MMKKKIGRPKIDGVGVKQVTFTMTENDVKSLRAVAARMGTTASDAVRRLVQAALEFGGK